MNHLWEYFWMLVVLFSLVSFGFMSVKILYRGISELKEMFLKLSRSRENE